MSLSHMLARFSILLAKFRANECMTFVKVFGMVLALLCLKLCQINGWCVCHGYWQDFGFTVTNSMPTKYMMFDSFFGTVLDLPYQKSWQINVDVFDMDVGTVLDLPRQKSYQINVDVFGTDVGTLLGLSCLKLCQINSWCVWHGCWHDFGFAIPTFVVENYMMFSTVFGTILNLPWHMPNKWSMCLAYMCLTWFLAQFWAFCA